MVSVDLIRKYKFFDHLNDDQLKAVSMIAEIETYPKGSLVARENSTASKLYLLLEGAIVNALVGSIAPGEVFGVSSLIEPYQFISSVRADTPIRVIAIDAIGLRAMAEIDAKLGYALMCKVSSAVLERLKFTQMELAVARA
jgi:CRP-like cAMP-binding protein